MPELKSQLNKDELYNALLRRDKTYDGFVWVCVKTTGIYCKLSCSARKPLKQNVEFVFSCEEARNLNFRECKICHPTKPVVLHPLTTRLIQIIDQSGNKFWRNSDLKHFDIDESSARRAFKKDLGISFIEYTRQRRLANALTHLKNGARTIDAQLEAGFNSPSGFVDAVKKNFGANPSELFERQFLSATWLETPIGPMLCICDHQGLHLLEFAERIGLAKELQVTIDKIAPICFQNHPYHQIVHDQIKEYFAGTRDKFDLKIAQWGTKFEKNIWRKLQEIPYAQTRSYSQIAQAIDNDKAARAVARANGANKIAIVIPCHRVIGSDGSMTGYGGQIWRKEWLLNHEKKFERP